MNTPINRLKDERNMEAATEIAKLVANREGFTYCPVTGKEPKQGYAVSVGNEIHIGMEANTGDIMQLVEAFFIQREAGNHSLFIGGWYDKENKRYELNLTQVDNSLGMAICIANQKQQRYIFDLETGLEIAV